LAKSAALIYSSNPCTNFVGTEFTKFDPSQTDRKNLFVCFGRSKLRKNGGDGIVSYHSHKARNLS